MDIDFKLVLEGLKKIKSGKLVSVNGNMMFTKGSSHITCWEKSTDPVRQLFTVEISQLDNVISTLESKTSEKNI